MTTGYLGKSSNLVASHDILTYNHVMENKTGKELNTETVTISKEEYDALVSSVDRYKTELDDIYRKYDWLVERLKTVSKDRFGSRSDKASEEVVGQMSLLFDEPEFYAYLESVKEETTDVAAHKRTVKKEKTYARI